MSVLRFYLVIARAWGWSGTDGARVLRSFVDLARKHSYKVTRLLGKFVEIMHAMCAGCLSAQRCWPGGASLSLLNHGVHCCLQDLYRNCSCRIVGQEIWGVLLSPASSPRRGLGVGSSDSSRSQKWALEAVFRQAVGARGQQESFWAVRPGCRAQPKAWLCCGTTAVRLKVEMLVFPSCLLAGWVLLSLQEPCVPVGGVS